LLPVQSVHMENVDCPRIVADESRGVWIAKLLGKLVMFDVEGRPLPDGGAELKVPEEER